MGKICLSCSYPAYKCSACPLTFNYWTSLPQGYICSSGTSKTEISEERIREIVKDEIGNVFERAFSQENETKGLSFSQAFEIIRNDPSKGMRLPQWSHEVIIKVQNPDKNSKMTHPYLYVDSRKGKVPWRETFPELFSNEWEIVEDTVSSFLKTWEECSKRCSDTTTTTLSKAPTTSDVYVHTGKKPNTTYTSQ
jgi:hypothetical protein